MTRDELILAVALRMDEITPDAGLSLSVDGTDNNPLYALILGLIDESVLEIYTTHRIAYVMKKEEEDTDVNKE